MCLTENKQSGRKRPIFFAPSFDSQKGSIRHNTRVTKCLICQRNVPEEKEARSSSRFRGERVCSSLSLNECEVLPKRVLTYLI
ncbi:hypothetical protein CEXT_347871 [Caerostris extrusa]|uniref:Uncharacterized protein n=1 Tax=Caerostris extrusa TaxID=172846 RepID=A0AAV4WJ03_CAEEX|nr:hypothetical protein CEXT_347871 [Caerostris extrusa]